MKYIEMWVGSETPKEKSIFEQLWANIVFYYKVSGVVSPIVMCISACIYAAAGIVNDYIYSISISAPELMMGIIIVFSVPFISAVIETVYEYYFIGAKS